MTIPYNPASPKADEFINHQEILDTLAFADERSRDLDYCRSLLEKARTLKGLTHREAALLLECGQPDLTERIFHLAKEIKQKLYGNRIVMFAPLYLSNYCVNGCTYCPYHAVCGFSPDIPGGQSRSLKTFSDEEIWKKIREGVDENGKPLDRKTVQGNPDKRL